MAVLAQTEQYDRVGPPPASCPDSAFLPHNVPAGAEVLRPVSRLWPLGVVQVAAGDAHSAALLVDGRLLTWVSDGWAGLAGLFGCCAMTSQHLSVCVCAQP